MFYNLRFYLFLCHVTENCEVHHKAYLFLNSDRAILTVFQRGRKSPKEFYKAAKKKRHQA